MKKMKKKLMWTIDETTTSTTFSSKTLQNMRKYFLLFFSFDLFIPFSLLSSLSLFFSLFTNLHTCPSLQTLCHHQIRKSKNQNMVVSLIPASTMCWKPSTRLRRWCTPSPTSARSAISTPSTVSTTARSWTRIAPNRETFWRLKSNSRHPLARHTRIYLPSLVALPHLHLTHLSSPLLLLLLLYSFKAATLICQEAFNPFVECLGENQNLFRNCKKEYESLDSCMSFIHGYHDGLDRDATYLLASAISKEIEKRRLEGPGEEQWSGFLSWKLINRPFLLFFFFCRWQKQRRGQSCHDAHLICFVCLSVILSHKSGADIQPKINDASCLFGTLSVCPIFSQFDHPELNRDPPVGCPILPFWSEANGEGDTKALLGNSW